MARKGRPTKYHKKYCKAIVEYFDVEYTKTLTQTYTYKDGSVSEKEIEVANGLPTFEKFSVDIGVNRDTLLEWVKVHKDFSVAYKIAKHKQEAMWLSNSLKGLFPGAFTIFAGKNMFGWRDKRELDHTSLGESIAPYTEAQKKAIAKEIMERDNEGKSDGE